MAGSKSNGLLRGKRGPQSRWTRSTASWMKKKSIFCMAGSKSDGLPRGTSTRNLHHSNGTMAATIVSWMEVGILNLNRRKQVQRTARRQREPPISATRKNHNAYPGCFLKNDKNVMNGRKQVRRTARGLGVSVGGLPSSKQTDAAVTGSLESGVSLECGVA